MERTESATLNKVLVGAWRGATKACPRCGHRGLFEQWFKLRDDCPSCNLHFEREEGCWSGAIFANLLVTQVLFILLMVAAFVITWPDPPVAEMIIGSIIFSIAFPIFFYPFSKTFWMAMERIITPDDEGNE